MAKFTVFQGDDDLYYFRMQSFNKLHTLRSNGYTTEKLCNEAIISARYNASIKARYIRKNAWLAYTFHLESEAGLLLCRSESYASGVSRDLGIRIVQSEMPNAPVV